MLNTHNLLLILGTSWCYELSSQRQGWDKPTQQAVVEIASLMDDFCNTVLQLTGNMVEKILALLWLSEILLLTADLWHRFCTIRNEIFLQV